jgi:endogenous inhibitor of DNA gyrase (YacG/DUF329 family)
MKICPECQNVMKAVTSGTTLQFECKVCHTIVDSNDYDTWIDGESFTQEETAEMYDRLFKNAAFDRTGLIMSRQCGKCNIDYMKLVRVGVDQNVRYVCECGNQEEVNQNMTKS